MNRPRNRQPRPPREQNRGGGRGGRGGGSRAATSTYQPVPSMQQVTPGAAVSIVLKQDQPTGRQVQGIVQDLLTRGDHPRGIKVRLQDGRIGRVQAMSGEAAASNTISAPRNLTDTDRPRQVHAARHQSTEGLPPRTLADYLPSSGEAIGEPPSASEVTFANATAKCPICGLFEGDEIAVSRHVEEHLT